MHVYNLLIILNCLNVFDVVLTQRCCILPKVSNNWGPYLQQVTGPFEYIQGPFWDHRSQLLYFVDVHKGLVNTFNPETREIHSVHIDGDVAPLTPTRELNKFVVGVNNSVVSFTWGGKNHSQIQNFKILSTVGQDKPGSRFLDGKADQYGRLWWGTIGFDNATEFRLNEGSLYMVSKENQMNPDIKISPVNISNGLAWTRDNTKFYYTDAESRQIVGYDFDINTGTISNQQLIFDMNNYTFGGHTGGFTIDEEDNLFIAIFEGGEVIKVNSRTGELLLRIAIPARQVTSCVFGGRNLDTLFVTTSRMRQTDLENSYEPGSGAIFAITGLGTRGLPLNFADF